MFLRRKKQVSTVNQFPLRLKGYGSTSAPLNGVEIVAISKGRIRNCSLTLGTSLVFLAEHLKDSSKYF